jgi:hypothetical protein
VAWQGLQRHHRGRRAARDGAIAGISRGRDGASAAGIHLPARLDHDLRLEY